MKKILVALAALLACVQAHGMNLIPWDSAAYTPTAPAAQSFGACTTGGRSAICVTPTIGTASSYLFYGGEGGSAAFAGSAGDYTETMVYIPQSWATSSAGNIQQLEMVNNGAANSLALGFTNDGGTGHFIYMDATEAMAGGLSW